MELGMMLLQKWFRLNWHSKFKVVEETVQSDDSIMLKIIRQYNDYDCGDYLA
jgi:hypothetical protein